LSGTAHFDLADTAELYFDAALSVSAWVKGNPQTTGAIIGQWDSTLTGTNSSWLFASGFSNGGRLLAAVTADGGLTNAKAYETTQIVFDGTWHHVGMVYAGGTLKLYVDGAPAATTALVNGTVTSLNDATSPLSIGSAGGAGAYFQGSLDEVAVFATGLTDQNMLSLYASGTPLKIHRDPLGASLFAWWRLGDRPDDDATATTGAAHSDGPQDLTLVPMGTSGSEFVSDAP
jgi:hypothetical protein